MPRTCRDTWVLRLESLDAVNYAVAWLSQELAGQPVPDASLSNWMQHLARLDKASVGTGLVVMSRARGRKPWLEVRDAPAPIGPAGASIARVLAARDLAARLQCDEELLATRLRPSPDLEFRVRQRPNANGWSRHRTELRLAQGFPFAVKADPVATKLIGPLDGERTLREAVDFQAAGQDIDCAILLPQLPATIRHLLHLGLLVGTGREGPDRLG